MGRSRLEQTDATAQATRNQLARRAFAARRRRTRLIERALASYVEHRVEICGSGARLEHDLQPVLEHCATLRNRSALERDPLYGRHRGELDAVLAGFEWDLCSHRPAPRHHDRVRVVAWNVERGKRFEPLLGALTDDPHLRDADLLLLTEVDIGMGRSGNRNVPAELARALGMHYVFANYHLVLAPGDSAEQDHGRPNTLAMHGAAMLSRMPVRRFAAVNLPEQIDKFHVLEKRLGCKRLLLCEVELPDGPATIATVHLDPFASPRHRALQAEIVARAIERFGTERVLMGGDLNTNTYDLGSRFGLFGNVMHKLVRFGVEGTIRHYMTPERVFERGTFAALQQRGLRFEPYTDPERGSIYYDLTDPEVVDKSRRVLPKPVFRWLERRLQPWGKVVPMRIDWFAGRGLEPDSPRTLERVRHRGERISDHNPLVVDLRVASAPSQMRSG